MLAFLFVNTNKKSTYRETGTYYPRYLAYKFEDIVSSLTKFTMLDLEPRWGKLNIMW